MNNVITIHYDFTDGTELSYIEGLECKVGFTTCCLEFFDTYNENCTVIKKDGSQVSVRELMKNTGLHIDKDIRKAHNLRRMLVGNALRFYHYYE